ncbi:hypothetical protein ACRB8A_04580 [Arthrobacter sp. G.S.26]|uniref:hypothetical protein n=1 Tax=Arthrobacter sp. G.S.26 TaxID=3433706 RepID=UPI003D781A28
MKTTTARRFAHTTLLAAALAAIPTAAGAVPPQPGTPMAESFSYDFPAGVACAGFDLRVDASGATGRVRELLDRNGDVVRELTTGRGYDLTFTNLATNKTYFVRSSGSSQVTIPNTDGTFSSVIRGSALIILFPDDKPAGPISYVIKGRSAFDLLANRSTFTSLEIQGRITDVCAVLG